MLTEKHFIVLQPDQAGILTLEQEIEKTFHEAKGHEVTIVKITEIKPTNEDVK